MELRRANFFLFLFIYRIFITLQSKERKFFFF